MVTIILAEGFEPMEAIVPCDILRRGVPALLLGALAGFVLTKLETMFRSNSNRLSLSIAFIFMMVGLSAVEFTVAGTECGFSPLLVCMMLGTVFCNICPLSEDLMDRADDWSAPLLAVFFVISGAELELGVFADVAIVGIGVVYSIASFLILRVADKPLIGLFLESDQTEIMANAQSFIFWNSVFYIPLAVLIIYRYTIQGLGYSSLAMFAGVAEMIARALVGVLFVPLWGYFAACIASPVAWFFACFFLIPAYFVVFRKLQKEKQQEAAAKAQ